MKSDWNLDPETLLRNAHRLLKTKYRNVPLWSFIADLTGHGSTYSAEIATHFEWDPFAPASKDIPPRKARAKQPAIKEGNTFCHTCHGSMAQCPKCGGSQE